MVKPPASGLSFTLIWNVAVIPLLALVNLALALQASVSALAHSSVRNLTPMRSLPCLYRASSSAPGGEVPTILWPHTLTASYCVTVQSSPTSRAPQPYSISNPDGVRDRV